MFFETHYNVLTSEQQITPRSLRRRQLEFALFESATLSQDERVKMRQAWAEQESDHLRATRVMKVRGSNASNGKDFVASKYETVKVKSSYAFARSRYLTL
jgi:protein-serine/threonine kinase